MAGKIKKMIDYIIEHRSNGDPLIAKTTKAKICLKGIIPEQYSSTSDDDPQVIEKLKNLASELGITLKGEI